MLHPVFGVKKRAELSFCPLQRIDILLEVALQQALQSNAVAGLIVYGSCGCLYPMYVFTIGGSGNGHTFFNAV